MAWNKTGTREEILQVSLSLFFFRTVTLDRRVADGTRKGITGSAENSETVEAGDWKTSMDERGFFNRAQNVPLKKQQTLLTLHNSAKQNNSHL